MTADLTPDALDVLGKAVDQAGDVPGSGASLAVVKALTGLAFEVAALRDVLTRPDPIEPADAPEVDPRTVEVGWLVERRKGESVMRARVGFANGVQLDTPGAVLWWGGAARQGWTLHVIDRGESA